LLLPPTLDAVAQRGLLFDIETLHLDRGYDDQIVRAVCAAHGLTDVVISLKRKKGQAKARRLLPMGERWPVERTNSWFTNFGQLRRSTDRRTLHRLAMMALAATLILVVKLFLWADRFHR
ncbi:MAG: transposase family protein, partial [Candidatus Dormibacteria bacterium]